jgi:hypothetical protein
LSAEIPKRFDRFSRASDEATGVVGALAVKPKRSARLPSFDSSSTDPPDAETPNL